MTRHKRPALFLSQEEQDQVKSAVEKAEAGTSAEIRVYLEGRLPLFRRDPYRRARQIFAGLGMHNTVQRNGVLVYLATRSQRFAIVGDEELHKRVGDAFWQQTAQAMARHFREDRFADGLAEAVLAVGDHLGRHFPHQVDDVNELSDDIAFGK